jgi:DNA-binding transcriptional ArsR family regulator
MKRFFIALLFVILFSNLAKAENIFQYSVIAEIFNNNSVRYDLNIILVNHSSQNVIIPLGMPTNVKINTPECSLQPGNLETVLSCNIGAANKTTISIDYDANNVRRKDSYFLFTDSFKIINDTKILSVFIKLPEGSGLKEPTENSYSPAGALIGSDGRRPIINWVKNDLKTGDRLDVTIAFENIVEISSGFPMELILVVVLIVFSSMGLFYQFYWRGRNIKLIFPILKKDEKTIFNTILKHGNNVNQKIIVKDSGYSKAKVSKVLNSLKERGLIKLERIGRSNKVHIEKNFEKKA